jgi:diguanylate cyclase (GGDEF)-like protein
MAKASEKGARSGAGTCLRPQVEPQARVACAVLGGLLLVAGAGAIGGYTALRATQHEARTAAMEETLRLAAEQISLNEPASAVASTAEWAQAALRRPNTVAVGLLDVHRKLICAWPESPEIAALFDAARAVPAGSRASTVDLPGEQADALGLEAELTIVPLEHGPLSGRWGHLGWVTHKPSAGWWIPQAGGMLGAGVLAMVVAAAWSLRTIRRTVFEPVEALAASSVAREQLLQRDDEFGAVARLIASLASERDEARARAANLASTLENRVAHQSELFNRQLRRAEHAAEIDPLTGLANRRFIDARLDALLAAQRKAQADLAVVLFDMDNFKALNDTAGHAAGDELLRFIGELLRSTLREDDVAVRLGGDEFAIVIVDQSAAQVAQIAERIVKLFPQNAATSTQARVTLSAGVAGLRETNAADATALLQRADEALYAAKRAGKNAVRVAGPSTGRQLEPAGSPGGRAIEHE